MTYLKALEHAHLLNSEVEYIGEGAWHNAWKLTSAHHEPLVLRIPKKIAYKKAVVFDAAALKAEYGGTEIYYRCVNQISLGTAPSTFIYHVSEELTYTIESFVGKNVDLHQLNKDDAHKLGTHIGQLYREIERVNHGLKGFGFFAWNEEQGVHGQFLSDYREFITAECNEVMDDYEELSAKRPIFESLVLKDALQSICDTRLKEISHPVLTNQDASPENWLMDEGQIRIIDPLPIVYFGDVMAGNFMSLYETLFVEFAHTERYGKHRFHECKETLQSIADGFLKSYCAQNPQLVRVLRGEQLLQVLDSAVGHVRMLETELNEEQVIRYGSKVDIERRLSVFGKKINELTEYL